MSGVFAYRDAIHDDSPSSIPDRNGFVRFGGVKRPGPMGHAMARSGRGSATACLRHPAPGSLCPPVSDGLLSSKTRLHPSSTNYWRKRGAHASGAPPRCLVTGMPYQHHLLRGHTTYSGQADDLRAACPHRWNAVLCVGGSQYMVHTRLRHRLYLRLTLRIYERCLAIWDRRGHLGADRTHAFL